MSALSGVKSLVPRRLPNTLHNEGTEAREPQITQSVPRTLLRAAICCVELFSNGQKIRKALGEPVQTKWASAGCVLALVCFKREN